MVLERIEESQNTQPAFSLLRRGSLRFFAALQSEGWARQDSNLGPRDYESPALTAELQARLPMKNSVSFGHAKLSIDGMLTLSACLRMFATPGRLPEATSKPGLEHPRRTASPLQLQSRRSGRARIASASRAI